LRSVQDLQRLAVLVQQQIHRNVERRAGRNVAEADATKHTDESSRNSWR
jgi:hypothetical protein